MLRLDFTKRTFCSSLVDLNKEGYNVPIYVGKAVPAGARKGGLGMNVDHGLALFNRLSEHFGSVSKANNLNEKDFMCRYLVVDDIWIPLAESMLIERFKPLWNRCIDGFGNHDPGKGRYCRRFAQTPPRTGRTPLDVSGSPLLLQISVVQGW